MERLWPRFAPPENPDPLRTESDCGGDDGGRVSTLATRIDWVIS